MREPTRPRAHRQPRGGGGAFRRGRGAASPLPRLLGRLLLLLVGVGAGAGPLPALGAEPGAAPGGQALATAAAAYRRLPVEERFDGVVEPVQQSTVAAQVVAQVEAVLFDVDDFVPKGAVIVRLRDRAYRARLAQAEAGLKEARARLVEAEQEWRRVRDLHARKLAPRSQLDRAEAALDAARARVAAAEAAVAEAKEALAHTVVRAPYAGVVVARHVEVGETVRVGDPLMTGFSLERLRVRVELPQSFVAAVRRHRQARVILPGDPPREVAASSLTIFPYADPAAHSFRVRVGLPPGLQGVWPGTFVKVAFRTGEERRLVVPARAVVRRSEVTAVYVVGPEGRVSLRQVRLGRRLGESVEVLAGLRAGERVALDPVRATAAAKAQRAGPARGRAAGEGR
ncbi:MAG: efflux RND transporter periplasmic adaptor subunit [Gammaproteobacteria bacterium]|nr:MAG: efflux RND transporter periplasmic adaptor subunit [Gammaproteobacteria bacterium]